MSFLPTQIMPWKSNAATRFTKKASSPKRRRQWSAVANSALSRGASESSAVRQANAVVRDERRQPMARGGKKGGRKKKGRDKKRK